MADENELLREWRKNVMDSLRGIHDKLDVFDERLRIVEVGIIQKRQIEKLEKSQDEHDERLRSLEGYKQRLIGYALGAGLVAGFVFEVVKMLWKK